MSKVHGYKVFRSDWSCNPTGKNKKQYTCPGKFEEEGELDICGHGMHFCQNVIDCFNYYSFNSENKVAEVVAYGEVVTEDNKSCTNKLEIVREISWEEVLRLVNTGKACTGLGNAGGHNTGDYNAGCCNTGDYNTGNCNTRNYNTGNKNTGDCNTGSYNTGDYNTGRHNTGNCNTGFYNTGNRNTGSGNTGNGNTGNFNTGSGNTGNGNIGDHNTGNCNTGDWNTSSFNTGCFNTEEPKIMLFNKPSDITYYEWLGSYARRLLNQMPQKYVEWVYEKDMTDEEKAEHPTYKTTGGYLKVLDESECRQTWWNDLSEKQKDIIKAIPNFDPKIFFQCTGIRVE